MAKTLIIGAGRSALGAAKLLTSQGEKVVLSDISEKYPELIQEIRQVGLELIIGPQTADLLRGFDQLIVSPGLSPEIPILQAARECGLPILSEIDLAMMAFKGTVVGVTGTNGKSTTTTMIAHLLQKLGLNAVASGNIGIPPSLVLAEEAAPDCFVLELSSYQLDFSKAIKNICGLFLSFSPDHLERHGNMEQYFRAKWKLMLATKSTGSIIMPRRILQTAKQFGVEAVTAPITQILLDGETAYHWSKGEVSQVNINSSSGEVTGTGFSSPAKLPLDLSYHNQMNVVAAALAVRALIPADWNDLMHALQSYPWLPFRFQKIGRRLGFDVFNDSKSTNVESTLVALQSLREPAILLLGGFPKGESFAPIGIHKDRLLQVLAFGAAGPRICNDLSELKPILYPTLQLALAQLAELSAAKPAPIVFSPACSSFDEFKNFEDRGDYFNKIVTVFLDK